MSLTHGVCILLLVTSCLQTFCQEERFEYEYDILQRLENLENKLEATQKFNAVLEDRLKRTEDQNAASSQENALLEDRLKITKDQNAALTKLLQDQVYGGSTYICWGRTVCPGNGSELVYQSVAGGSHHTDTGAAVDNLCLPLDPEYGEHYDDAEQYGGYVYGAEYEFYFRSDRMKFFPGLPDIPKLYNQDVPCAVCRVPRGTTIMIPAKKSCGDGWTLEYKGMLVSGLSAHVAATEYICLDGEPEYVDGGGSGRYQKLLYFVEGRCGILPCPPYVNGRELTCVVCTK